METGEDSAGDTGPEPDPSTLDQDGDGFTPNEGDCDDERAHVYPGAPDYCDGLDADCDGEPIPEGSCSEVGDPRVMWSWSFEGFTDSWGWVDDALGDMDGDGREDVGLQGSEAGDGRGGVLFGSGLESWPARGPTPGLVWWSDWPQANLNGSSLPAGDVNADGYDDVWFSTDSNLGRTGGAYLLLGREGGFGDDLALIGEAADAQWLDTAGPELFGPVGAGEFNADGHADLLLLCDTPEGVREWSLIPGTIAPTGEHGTEDLAAFDLGWVENELVTIGAVVRDLDGDGFDEVLAKTARTEGDDRVLVLVEGENVTDGGTLADVGESVWLDHPGETEVAENGSNASPSDDVDGDGLNDLLLWTGDGATWSSSQCAALYSGGVPDGEFSALNTVTVCEAAFGWGGWQADIDGDGVREVQVIGARGWTPLLSSQLREGGVQSDADFQGPITYWGAYYTTTADFNGDGLPEWVYSDQQWDDPDVADEYIRTLILTGFEIPWDDPTKW